MTGGASPRKARAIRVAKLLSALVGAQSLAQLVGIVSGLALLRWLSVEEYAQYTVAFGFTATLTALIDLGFASVVMPLVGDRARDLDVVGSYLRAALFLRGRLAMVAIPVSAVAFFALTADRDWSLGIKLGLYASIPITVFARAMVDIYALPLLMGAAYRDFYTGQIGGAGLRLVALGALDATRALGSVAASVVGALTLAVNGVFYRRAARPLARLERRADRDRSREIMGMVAPVLPGTIFTAFQGQITVLLISAFGAVRAIAEVGALGRLGALFAVLGGVSGVVVAPRFPQLPKERVPRETAVVLGATAAFCVAISAGAFVFPEPLLLLLGGEYENLRREVAWFVVGASLGFLAGVAYSINLARRFIWYWSTWVGLSLIVSAQVAGALLFDLSSTLELQYFAALSGAGTCLAQAVGLAYGLRNGPRRQ